MLDFGLSEIPSSYCTALSFGILQCFQPRFCNFFIRHFAIFSTGVLHNEDGVDRAVSAPRVPSPTKVGLHSPGNNSQLFKKALGGAHPRVHGQLDELCDVSIAESRRFRAPGSRLGSPCWKRPGRDFPREREERSRCAQLAQLTTNSGMCYRSGANRPIPSRSIPVPFVDPSGPCPRAFAAKPRERESNRPYAKS